MTDLLVKLYDIEDAASLIAQQRDAGIIIRRALPPERNLVVNWVRKHFGDAWASETEVAFGQPPPHVILAVEDDHIVGFACYEATAKDFFGPTGVDETYRGRGIGRVLLLAALHELRNMGYAYAIIGWAGPVEFYKRYANAIEIEGSRPGYYEGVLFAPDDD